jgi:hypothetical protein
MRSNLNTLILICYLIVVSANLGNAQTITDKQQKIIKATVAKQFGEVSNTLNFDNEINNICTIGIDTFYNRGGFYYLFKLKGDSAIRLDRSSYHGSNFNSYFFSWQNTIYLLGGYGFFTTHNNLISFNENKREWAKVNTGGNGPEFIHGISFRNNNKIYSFNNFKAGNNVSKDILDSNLYVLDLPAMQWQKYKMPIVDLIVISNRVNTADYFWYQNDHLTILINKKEIKFEIIENEKLNLTRNNNFRSFKDNLLLFEESNPIKSYRKITQLNLDSVWLVYIKSSSALYKPNQNTTIQPRNGISPLWFLISIIPLILILIIYRRKTKATANKIKPIELDQIQNNQLEILALKIKKFNKRILNMEELDNLLEITHLEAESRKLRRFRRLSELNQLSPGFIIRVKDEEDKRRFLYQINLPQND